MVGAIVGGLLFGLIGAIVGGILLPLILWLTTEGVEGVVERAAQEIADALNDLSPSVDVPAVGIELIFSDVFIDDVTIAGRLRVTDNAPVRAEGTVVLPNGVQPRPRQRQGRDARPAAQRRSVVAGLGVRARAPGGVRRSPRPDRHRAASTR